MISNEIQRGVSTTRRAGKRKKKNIQQNQCKHLLVRKNELCLLMSNIVISWTEQRSKGVASDLQKQWRTHKQPKQLVLLFQRRAKESKHMCAVHLFEHPPLPPGALLSVCPAVTEWGDDVRPISEEEAMVIVNHQSTGDVCTLMMCLQDKGTVRTDTPEKWDLLGKKKGTVSCNYFFYQMIFAFLRDNFHVIARNYHVVSYEKESERLRKVSRFYEIIETLFKISFQCCNCMKVCLKLWLETR